MAEEVDLKSIQSRFESEWGYAKRGIDTFKLLFRHKLAEYTTQLQSRSY